MCRSITAPKHTIARTIATSDAPVAPATGVAAGGSAFTSGPVGFSTDTEPIPRH
jgi:hypothetical protein